MTFIGIIIDENKGKYIEKVLNKYLEHQYKVIFINESNIENIKNIRFDTILIIKNNYKLFKENNTLRQIIQNAKYLIINSDMENNLKILNNLSANVITYGFNSKASITASSVTNDYILLCVQRNMQTINGSIIENQEIKVNFDESITEYLPDDIMGIVTLLLIYDKKDVKI